MTDISELSDREREILHLVATGASNKEIAKALYISTNTVKVHLRNIFGKIGVSSRTEAAMYAVSAGLVEPVTSTSEDGFTVVSGDGDTGGNGASQTLSGTGSWQVFARNPWLIVLVFALVAALGLASLFWINQVPSGTLASNGAPVVAQQPRWQARAALLTSRSGLAVVSYENQVYAVGGESAEGTTSTLERYDPSEDRWVALSPKPTAVTDVRAAVIGGLLYVPGGRLASGNPSDRLEVYDPREDQWETAASLPVALSAYALAAFEGKLYLFGGWDGEDYRRDVYEYDPDNDVWSARTPMPSARAYAGASVAGGRIFVIGGYDGEEALRINEAYQPELDNGSDDPWEARSPLEEGRYAMGVAGVADIIYIVGGKGTAGELAAGALSYFPQTDTWQEIDNPEQAGSDLGLVVLETRLYAIGGQIGEQPTGRTLEYQAIYTISIPVVR